MNMYEVLNLLFLGGTFLIALLAYIDSCLLYTSDAADE